MSMGPGGGFGGMEQALTYMIKAYDMATPVFKAFQDQVAGTTRSVQASLTEMNKALEAQSRVVSEVAASERASLGEISKGFDTAAMSSIDAAKFQADAAKQMAASQSVAADAAKKSAATQSTAADSSVAASRKAATAAKASADEQAAAAAKSEAAFGVAGSALSKFGRDTLLVGVGVAGVSLDMATKFQANTLRMETQAGATAKGLGQIQSGLLSMAGQVGVVPNTLANGMYHVVSAMNAVLPPTTRVQQELTIMKIAAEGAQVGHSNLEETTYALSSALNALHMSAKDASGVMGQLNAIVGSGDMTMQDLVDAFKSGLIPAADSFGVSLQSVGAALSVMGDMGMRGALAGTRLRMALSLLGAPSKQAAGILETLGLSSTQAMASTKKMSDMLVAAGVTTTMLTQDLRKPDGLQVALLDLDNHLRSNGLSADAAGAAISRAFGGGRMGAAIMLLAENTDRLKLKFNQIGTSGQQFGADWKKTADTFKVELEQVGAGLEALGIRIGTDLMPYARDAVKDLEDMANWLAKNQQVLEGLGLAVGTFATIAIGSYFIGKVSKAIGLMKEFSSGTQSMGRWLLNMPAGGPAGATGAAATADRSIMGRGAMGSPASALLGGSSGALIWGYTGSTMRVGTMMNPIAVTIAGKGENINTSGSGGSDTTVAGPVQSKVPAGTVVNQAGEQDSAELDRRLSELEAEQAATVAGGPARDSSGKFISASQAATQTEIASVPPGVASLREAQDAEQKAMMAFVAEQQILTNKMPQLTQDASLFDDAALAMTEAMTKAEEQLSLGGIANREGGLTAAEVATTGGLGVPGRATKNLTGQIIPGMNNPRDMINGDPLMAELTDEELFAARFGGIPGAHLAGPTSQLGMAEGIPTMGGGMLSSAKGFLGNLGGGLMRGGMIAGMGALGSQAIGGIIGGKTGREVGNIGTDVSLGAGAGAALGSVIPVLGTAVGTMVGGIGGAIIGGITTLFHNQSYGAKIADSLTPGFGGAKRDDIQQTVTNALNNLNKITSRPDGTTIGPRGSVVQKNVHLNIDQLSPADQLKADAAANVAGNAVAKQLEKGWNSYKFQDTGIMSSQFASELKKLPPQAQDAAAQSAVKFVEGLQSKGRIAAGSAGEFLGQIEAQFPGFAKYMGISAQDSINAFNKALDFKTTEQQMSTQLHKVEDDFSPVQDIVSQTAGTIQDKMTVAVESLKMLSDGTGKSAAAAKADLKDLQNSTNTSLTAMVTSFATNTGDMTTLLKQGSQAAMTVAETNYGKMLGTIQGDIQSGAETTRKGMGQIGDALNAMLKSFGEPKIDFTGISKTPGIGGLTLSGLKSALKAPGGATGMKVDSPQYIVGEEAPTHPEYVLATNPAYRSRNVNLWKAAGRDLGMGVPGFAMGGYIDPIPGFQLGRTDMGLDAHAAPGTPILAIGDSRLTDVIPGWFEGQPLMDFQLLNGPDAGRYWYVAEQIIPTTNKTGSTFKAGQVVARYAPTGTGIEIGWAANASGQTLAQGTTGYHEGQVTQAGQSFTDFVAGLSQGKIVGGGPGATNIPIPKVTGTGPMASIAQAALGTATDAANMIVASLMGTGTGIGGGLPNLTGGSSAKQIYDFFSGKGLSKIAISGIIGNWMQESSLNPATPGGGLAQWIGARGQALAALANSEGVSPSSEAAQLQFAWQELSGPYRGALNAIERATSPAQAAQLFSQLYEMPGVPVMSNRIGYAQSAYQQGYKIGGRRPQWGGMYGDGGMFSVTQPTLALFGEKGPETVLAVAGNNVNPYSVINQSSSTSSGTTSKGHPTHTTSNTTTSQNGNQRTTTTQSTHSGPTGTSHSTTTTTRTVPDHWTWGYNPLTNHVEFHDTDQWRLIHAEYSQQRRNAEAEKKKAEAAQKALNRYMAQPVTDTLLVGTIGEGQLDLTRKQAKKLDFPFTGKGGSIQLEKDLNNLSQTAWDKIVTELTKEIATQSLTTQMNVAHRLSANLDKEGDHPLIKEQNVLQKHLRKLTHEHQTKSVRHQETVARNRLSTIGDEIQSSRPAQLANTAITAALANVTNSISSQDTAGTIVKNLKSDLTKLDKMLGDAVKTHNQKLMDKITKEQSSMLKSAVSEVSTNISDQSSEGTVGQDFQGDMNKLKQIQKDARKKGMTAIVNSAGKAIQSLWKSLIDENAQNLQTTNDKLQGSSDLITAIQGLKSGTNLSSIGLTPKVLQSMGLNPGQMSSLTGGDNPMAAAQISNTFLGQQRSNDASALQKLMTEMPHLSGSALDDANSQVKTLTSSIATLTTQINQNLLQAIQATAQAFQDQADTAKAGGDLMTSIANMPAGTNLSALGLSPGTLSSLGIDPGTAASIMGGGPAAIAAEQAAQNGQLTPAQMSEATAYYNGQNTNIQSQLGGPNTGLVGELNFDESQLPSLTGSDRTTMVQTIDSLGSTIAGLITTMGDNTTALNSLTSATNANTSATGQMTGTVGYTYQNQQFVAGGSMTSDVPVDIAVGI